MCRVAFTAWSLVVGFCLSVVLASGAHAHKASDAYLKLEIGANGSGRMAYALALRDWDLLSATLDADSDRRITWSEARAAMPELLEQLSRQVELSCGRRRLDTAWRFDGLESRSDGAYVRLVGDFGCTSREPLFLRYTLLAQADPTHRLLVSRHLIGPSGSEAAAVLAAGAAEEALLLSTETGLDSGTDTVLPEALRTGLPTAQAFFAQGFAHIGSGYDHLAFLLALLLPLRLYGKAGATGTSARRLVNIVTCFTVGHSLTLGLAAFDLVRLDERWVEPLIALSIAVSAFHNLRPVKGVRTELFALVFGWIHGLGFAGALSNVDPERTSMLWALAGFNLGVEAGQLFAVAVWCIVQALLARRPGYPLWIVRGGSVALGLAGLGLTVQRLLTI